MRYAVAVCLLPDFLLMNDRADQKWLSYTRPIDNHSGTFPPAPVVSVWLVVTTFAPNFHRLDVVLRDGVDTAVATVPLKADK